MAKINLFIKMFKSFPLETLILYCFIGFGLIVALFIVGRIMAKLSFLRRLTQIRKQADKAIRLNSIFITPNKLLKYSSLIQKQDRKWGTQLFTFLEIDKLLIERLVVKKKRSDFIKALSWIPEKSLFSCFLICLKKKTFAPFFIKNLEEKGEALGRAFILKELAQKGCGESFKGRDAFKLLEPWLLEIREMVSDPLWTLRYFAFKILFYDREEKTQRSIWDAFTDAHPLVRKVIIDEFKTSERTRLYEKLLNRVLQDPVFEVRQSAWQRIQDELADLFFLDFSALKENEIYHVLELLRTGIKEDENLALHYLDSENLELRYMAACFLAKNQILERLCRNVDLGDKVVFDRNFRLLKKASEVNVNSFLAYVDVTNNPATLLICAKILVSEGNRSLVTTLAKKVFSFYREPLKETDALFELYNTTLACISERGNEDALQMLDRELHKRKDQEQFISAILKALPERGEEIFLDSLFPLFTNPEFKCRKPLRDALLRMSQARILPVVFDILKSPREFYPHIIRIEAVKLLGEMGLPFCFQAVLENIPVLPLDEAREYAALLAAYSKEVFKQKVEELLQSVDVKIRSSIISLFPALKDKEYIKYIMNMLKDSEPDVRIASIWSFLVLGEDSSCEEVLSLLRDPVGQVREEAAQALGEYGGTFTLREIDKILQDEHETGEVKKAAILGLKKSKLLDAVDILVERLETEDQLTKEQIEALASKTKKHEVRQLIYHFKAACPRLREKLSLCFKKMKEKGEDLLVELFQEDHPVLTPYLVDIFETTGYIEKRIRQLTHRDSKVRGEAASFLSALGSPTAFRGVVLAARDPDKEVRVKVVKALEKLDTEDGKIILNSLRNDPDRRIRKYTEWALERIKTKSLTSL
jgi:HEAT repeat protein